MTALDKINRFEPYNDEGNREGYGQMIPDPSGDWVLYADAAAEIARLRHSLRDYFAGQAIGDIISVCANDTRLKNESAPEAFARKSYEIADAMLAAREPKP